MRDKDGIPDDCARNYYHVRERDGIPDDCVRDYIHVRDRMPAGAGHVYVCTEKRPAPECERPNPAYLKFNGRLVCCVWVMGPQIHCGPDARKMGLSKMTV